MAGPSVHLAIAAASAGPRALQKEAVWVLSNIAAMPGRLDTSLPPHLAMSELRT